MGGDVPEPIDPLHAWIDRCQCYVEGPALRAGDACQLLGRMVASVPAGLSAAQQAVVRRLLDEAWGRLLSLAVPETVSIPVVTSTCARLSASRVPEGPVDLRVSQALTEIDRRYADPRLRLHALARQLALSPTHLTQLLKASTGRTFGAHVHERRVAAARALLAGRSLSIKEIASRVGYASTTQLDRHFKKLTASLPSECRAWAHRSVARHEVGATRVVRPRHRPHNRSRNHRSDD